MDLVIQLSFIVAILLYGVTLSKLVPSRYHFLANIFSATTFVGLALMLDFTFSDIGLSFKHVWPSLLVAFIASAVILVSVFLISLVPFARKYFKGSHSALRSSPSRLAYETAVRIPLSTALTEEILFRGVLLGVLLTYNTTFVAITISSIIFGLWHIFPALNATNKSYYLELRRGAMLSRLFHVAADVLATSIAGLFFAWLRILSGSILAPWLVHWTINSSAVLSGLFAARAKRTK